MRREADVLGAIREARRKKEPAVAEIGAPDKRIQFAAIPILHSPKSAGSVVGIFHDVTKVKQTERIRRDFVANVSHELRTPLSIFRGNLETLLEEPALAEDERTHIYQAMKRHSDRLNLLAEDLLKLARLESKEMSLEIAPVKLADFLQRVTKDWSPRLKAGNLHIDLQVSPNLPPLPADEFRLEQVVHNLLDNAVNYSHPGGCITVAANETQNEIILSVADEGVEFRRPICHGSSSDSTALTGRAAASSAAPVWGCRSLNTSPSSMAAMFPRKASKGKAPSFACFYLALNGSCSSRNCNKSATRL